MEFFFNRLETCTVGFPLEFRFDWYERGKIFEHLLFQFFMIPSKSCYFVSNSVIRFVIFVLIIT